MSYLDSYKSMLLKRGGNVLNADIKNSKDSINKQFKNDPSYKLATLKKKDKAIVDSELDTRIVNNTNDKTKKNIYVRPNAKIEVGDYITYPDKTYLVLEVEENLISPYAESKECNHLFKWMYKGVVYSAYGIGTNQTKYTLGTSNLVVGITESDSRYSIDFPNDFNCKTIKVGQRFIFNDGAWKVTQIEYVSSQDAIRSILLGQDSINYEIDDVDNEIAGAYENKHTYTYDIPTSFEVANGSEYTINYSIKDELGKDFDYSLVNVITTNNALVQVTNTNGVISIKGLSVGIGSIKLSIPIGSTSKDFDISFEVKDIVADKIEYKYDFSQGTTLKTYMSTTLDVSKFMNSVQDSSLYINYSFDNNTQNLINQSKIVVTRKSNSSISIKNSSITTPTIIYLTVTDSINNTNILDNLAITLKGM